MIFLSVRKEYNTMEYTQNYMTNSIKTIILNRNWRNPKIIEKYQLLFIFEKSRISRHFMEKWVLNWLFRQSSKLSISWEIFNLSFKMTEIHNNLVYLYQKMVFLGVRKEYNAMKYTQLTIILIEIEYSKTISTFFHFWKKWYF